MNEAEVDQLKALLGQILQGQQALVEKVTGIEARLGKLETAPASVAIQPVEPRSAALALKEPDDEKVILCLDFGTARSKAFATSGYGDEDLLDLAIGSRAGQGFALHSLLSCVFISDDGLFWFGEEAARRSEQAVGAGSRRRFESFKSMLTHASPGSDLRSVDCHKESNPTAVRLTDGDVLTMYLAYLTDMAVTELQLRHGRSRHVRRRFTMPVFKDAHGTWCEAELRKHFAEALLVADHFSGRWDGGIPVSEAAGVLLGATRRHRDVLFLVGQALIEPVAAFGSRFRDVEGVVKKRTVITVVDIGAGTTDFASFSIVPTGDNPFKMARIPGSVGVFRKAGDEVDRLLYEYILKEAAPKQVGADESAMARVKADLRLNQRGLKERLFADGEVRADLSDNNSVVVRLDRFLNEDNVREFSNSLKEEFARSLEGIHESWFREGGSGEITVIATGGGSRLPFIKDQICSLARARIPNLHYVKYATAVPPWVTEDFEELTAEYPQLAVAIGGAARELPLEAESTFDQFSGMGGNQHWTIPPIQKGV